MENENEFFRYVVINGNVNMKYKISNFGRIMNVEKNNKVLKQTTTVGGYKIVGIDTVLYHVHRLMLLSHVGIDPNPERIYCDHINGDRSDNRITNLRWTTYSENAANKKIRHGKDYKGIYYIHKTNRYVAKLMHNRRCYHLGTFPNTPEGIESAKIAYNEKAIDFFGEYACLNPI